MVEEGVVCTFLSFYAFVWIASVDAQSGGVLVCQSIVCMCIEILGGGFIGGKPAGYRSLCASLVLIWTCDATWR